MTSMQLDEILRRCVLDDTSISAVARETGIPQATLQEFAVGKADGSYSDLRLSSAQKLIEHYGIDQQVSLPTTSRKGKCMLLATELAACGCSDSPEKFKERLIDGLTNWFPGRSIDSIVCNPEDALAYCHQIFEGIGAEYLHEAVILKTLMNIRKSKHCPTDLRSKGPRRHLTTRLRDAGCDIPADDFRDLVCDCLADMYKSRTIDEIVCHPKQAHVLCNFARMKAKCDDLSDELILNTIMNVRKAG